MADFSAIKTEIQTNIRTNGNQEITGAVLQETLIGMVDATDENITELESEMNTFYEFTEVGGGLKDGSFGTSQDYCRTPFVAIGENVEGVLVKGYAGSTISLLNFYDINKTFIGYYEISAGRHEIFVDRNMMPQGVSYVVASGINGEDNKLTIRLVSNVVAEMQEIGIKHDKLSVIVEKIQDELGVEKLKTGLELVFNDRTYQSIPVIASNAYWKIEIISDLPTDNSVTVYGRTIVDSGDYQSLGYLSSDNKVIEGYASLDINYLRLYPTYIDAEHGDVFPATIIIYAYTQPQKDDNQNSVPCMVNPTINFRSNSFKVLDIGNSYTQDAQTYLPYIIGASGIGSDFSLFQAIRSSASFKSWVDCYYDQDTREYSVGVWAGEGIDGVGGVGSANDGTIFRNALEAVQWDVILIHQASAYANDYSLWEGNGQGGYLKEFIQILRKTNPQATIGFLLIHSYRSSYSGNEEGSSLIRWENIAKATQQFKAHYGVDFIIPYGTAVQNLRASSLNDDNEFSTDGTHMATGLGDYVSSCCYYQSLFAPRYGKSILGNTFRDTSLDESEDGVKKIDDANALVAQKAAMLATYNMWEVMNPDDYEL